MSLSLMGRKKGMMQTFDANGNIVVCSVIHVEPNIISQIKSKENDGYEAVQLAAFQVPSSKKKNISKPLRDAYAKKNIEPRRMRKETRVSDIASYAEGQEVGVSHFADCAYVDVTGVSKGKGHQGVMKRHNFAGGPAAHGSGFHRHGGSCGMRSSPGRCLPGQKKSGRMGGEQVTVQSLKIVKIDEEKQVVLVEGAIPGANDSVVYMSRAKKKLSQKTKK